MNALKGKLTGAILRQVIGGAAVVAWLLLTAGCGGGGGGGGGGDDPKGSEPVLLGGAVQGTALNLSGDVTALAGTFPSVDGDATTALFRAPMAIARDSVGNFYVADACTIRKVDASGNTTTLVGDTNNCGAQDGDKTTATIDGASGMVTDGTSLYFSSLNCIRRVTISSGAVTTIAGTCFAPGNAGGVGLNAGFDSPKGLALNGTQTLYIADWGNHVIRSMNLANGQVNVLAGSMGNAGTVNAAGTSARLNHPWGLSYISNYLFFTDNDGTLVRQVLVSPSAQVTTLAGDGTAGSNTGNGAGGQFSSARGIHAISTSRMYIADAGNHQVRALFIDNNYMVGILAGSTYGEKNASGYSAQLAGPSDLVLDGGSLVVTDELGRTLRRVSTSTAMADTFVGKSGGVDGTGPDASFGNVGSVTTDGTNLYVSDSNGNTVRKVVIATGDTTTVAGTRFNPAGLGWPEGITTDGTYLYLCDPGSGNIRKVTLADGSVSMLVGSGVIQSPRRITTDNKSLYVTDTNAAVVYKVDPVTGQTELFAGALNTPGDAVGTRAAARFTRPLGITTDGKALYVAEWNASQIKRISLTTDEVTSFISYADNKAVLGTGELTTDGKSLFVNDNTGIYQVDLATRALAVVAGSDSLGYADGKGTAARFRGNVGLTTDGKRLFAFDAENAVVRAIQ